jgi:hypothetical protein
MGGASSCLLLPSLLQVRAKSRSKGLEPNTSSYFASSFLGTNFTLLVFCACRKPGQLLLRCPLPRYHCTIMWLAVQGYCQDNLLELIELTEKRLSAGRGLFQCSLSSSYIEATRQDSGLNSEQGQLGSTSVCSSMLPCYRTLSQRQCRWANLGSTRRVLRTEAVGASHIHEAAAAHQALKADIGSIDLPPLLDQQVFVVEMESLPPLGFRENFPVGVNNRKSKAEGASDRSETDQQNHSIIHVQCHYGASRRRYINCWSFRYCSNVRFNSIAPRPSAWLDF